MAGGPVWTRIVRNLRAEREARRHPPVSQQRDMTAAVGSAGGPASWRRAVDGAEVALHSRDGSDARWSSIFARGSGYAVTQPVDPEWVAEANRRGRRGAPPTTVQGPMMKAAVWTWEVPLYFWFGGMTAGSTFVALGCDLAGDRRAARISRRVALVALVPCPPLLIADLGRPERFFNMLRIFKTRSPMSTGSWCLSAYGALAAGAVGADLVGFRRSARTLGAINVPVGMYLGSYTGVLLASTAVPLWSASRRFLGAIFVAGATMTGAAACRLTLSAAGAGPTDPTRQALAHVEDAAMAAELILATVNRQRRGSLSSAMDTGPGAPWFARARQLGRAGLAARVLSQARGPRRRLVGLDHVASVCFAGSALCFRYAWVRAGQTSAGDDEAVARHARERAPAPLVVTQHG